MMISRMAKPEEVLVVESEDGEIVRETTKDTDALVRPREGNREKRAVPRVLCAVYGVYGAAYSYRCDSPLFLRYCMTL